MICLGTIKKKSEKYEGKKERIRESEGNGRHLYTLGSICEASDSFSYHQLDQNHPVYHYHECATTRSGLSTTITHSKDAQRALNGWKITHDGKLITQEKLCCKHVRVAQVPNDLLKALEKHTSIAHLSTWRAWTLLRMLQGIDIHQPWLLLSSIAQYLVVGCRKALRNLALRPRFTALLR